MWKSTLSSQWMKTRASSHTSSRRQERPISALLFTDNETMHRSRRPSSSNMSSTRNDSTSTQTSLSSSLPSASLMRLIQICVTINLGGLLAGTHLALFSGILEMPQFSQVLTPTGLTSTSKSIITASLIGGFCLFSIPAGRVPDMFGRRPALILSASLFTLAPIFTLLTGSNQYTIVIGRIIAGAAYSFANVVCPMFTAEISPPSMRGMLVNLYQLSITVGILFAQICNLILFNGSWTGPIKCSIVPSIIMLGLVWLSVPESPTWLSNRLTKDNKSPTITSTKGSNATNVAKDDNVQIEPTPINTMDLDIEDQISTKTTSTSTAVTTTPQPTIPTTASEEISSTLPIASPVIPASKNESPNSILLDASARKRIYIGTVLCAGQQLSGINSVIFFGPAIINDVLHWNGSNTSLRAACLIGLTNVIATIISILLIDRLGRRSLLLAGGPPMVATLVTLGAMRMGIVNTQDVTGILSLVLYISAFAITYGPIPFVVCSEIFPVRYKGMAMSICNGVLGGCSLIVGLTFLPLLELLGGGIYLLYAGCMVIVTMFVWKMVPETRKLSLQEIDELLEEKAIN